MSTRETFVDWRDGNHLRWMKDCREAGDVLRLLVGALDDDGLEGADLTRFGTDFGFRGAFEADESEREHEDDNKVAYRRSTSDVRAVNAQLGEKRRKAWAVGFQRRFCRVGC